MNRRNFLNGLLAGAAGLWLPYKPERVYSFPTSYAPFIWGNGSDGDLYVTGPIELTRNVYYDNIIVPPGQQLQINCNGYVMHCAGTLSISL